MYRILVSLNVFTDSDMGHASIVFQRLGLEDCFDTLNSSIDINSPDIKVGSVNANQVPQIFLFL